MIMKKFLFALCLISLAQPAWAEKPKFEDDDADDTPIQISAPTKTKGGTGIRTPPPPAVAAVTRDEFDALKKRFDAVHPENIVLNEERAEYWFYRFLGAVAVLVVVILLGYDRFRRLRKQKQLVDEAIARLKGATEATTRAEAMVNELWERLITKGHLTVDDLNGNSNPSATGGSGPQNQWNKMGAS